MSFERIKLVFSDIDGVWTDGGMVYADHGDVGRVFNTSDSAGVLFLRQVEIPLVIISGENSLAVDARLKKLGISEFYLGEPNKVDVALTVCERLGVDISDAAHLGDDIGDVGLFREVGLSACPSTARTYIQSEVDWVLDSRGGAGVFREFVERLLLAQERLDEAIALTYRSLGLRSEVE